ncbi:MAG: methyltransferase [Alphaproteobacteria bacterium]|nr:methyltransferase [Alphaproteobacteria bacterium]
MPTRARRSLDEVRLDAQRLAMAPITFQAVRALRDLGLLRRLYDSGPADVDALAEHTGLPRYGALVLLEMGLSARVVTLGDDGRFDITPTGILLDRDPMTRANMDFTQDVCYRGLEHLQAAVREGRPAGLAELSPASTIYEALATLPEPARTSWFAFDHFYSDAAFAPALERVLAGRPRRIVDVGANTGRFARAVLTTDPDVHVALVDHPGQLVEAEATLREAGLLHRATLHAADLLDPEAPLPEGADVVWLSQLLDCFAEHEIVSILRRARAALAPGGRVAILELLWDRQRFEAGTFILHATSLYFTVMANGTSRMYSARAFLPLIAEAGLRVVEDVDDVGGVGHTLLVCEAA